MNELAVAGIMGSLLTGAMTGIGGLVVMLSGRPDEKRQNLLMGFAAGVMIAAAFFSLIIPGIERAQISGHSFEVAAFGVIAAVVLGALAISQLGGWIEAAACHRLAPPVLASWPEDAVQRRV